MLVIVSGLASLGGLCGPGGSGIPEPDECDEASSDAVVASLELGGRDGDTFEPIEEGQTVTPVTGGQGGSMLPVRMRLRGEAVPTCIAQQTTLTDAVGNVFLQNATPLQTYSDGEGTRTTRPHYLIFDGSPDPGDWITLTVEAAGHSAARSVWFTTPYDGPEIAALSAPTTVLAGQELELRVTLDGPRSDDLLPIVLRASPPGIVDVPSRFYIAPVSEDITLPANAIGPGEVEILAASGRIVQSVRIAVTSSADGDAGL